MALMLYKELDGMLKDYPQLHRLAGFMERQIDGHAGIEKAREAKVMLDELARLCVAASKLRPDASGQEGKSLQR